MCNLFTAFTNNPDRFTAKIIVIQSFLVLFNIGFVIEMPAIIPLPWDLWKVGNDTALAEQIMAVPVYSCASLLPAVLLLNEFIGFKRTICLGALARLAALVAWILAETEEMAEFGCTLSGLAQSTRVVFYCYIFRLVKEGVHRRLFWWIGAWVLLGPSFSSITLQLALSAPLDDFNGLLYYSLVPTSAAFVIALLWIPQGVEVNGGPPVNVSMNTRQHKGSPCRWHYWNQLASDFKSSLGTSDPPWTVWCYVMWVILYGIQTNVAILLALSDSPSPPYGPVYTLAAFLGSLTTVLVNALSQSKEYSLFTFALFPLMLATLVSLILSENGIYFAEQSLVHVAYTCVTYASSTLLLFCFANVHNDVFHLVFGVVVSVACLLQSVAQYALNSRLVDSQTLLFIYCALQFLVNIFALMTSSISKPSLADPVTSRAPLPEDFTVSEFADEKSVVSLAHSEQNNENSLSISDLEP